MEVKTNFFENLGHPNVRGIRDLDHFLGRVKKSALGFREPNLRFLMVPKMFSLVMYKMCYKLSRNLTLNVIKAWNL